MAGAAVRAGTIERRGFMSKIQSVPQNTASVYPQSYKSAKKDKEKELSWEDERALQMFMDYQESKKANENNKKPVEYNGSELIRMLSSARGRTDIHMVVSKCYQTLSQLLAAAGMDGADNKKISSYIAHVKKIIRSAEKKLRHVVSEEAMERRIQSAQKQEEHEKQEEALKEKKVEKQQQALKVERAKRQTHELQESYKKKKKRHLNEEKKDIQKLEKTHPDRASGVEDLFPLPGTTSGNYQELPGLTSSAAPVSQAAGTGASLSQAAGVSPSVSPAGASPAPVSLDVTV